MKRHSQKENLVEEATKIESQDFRTARFEDKTDTNKKLVSIR